MADTSDRETLDRRNACLVRGNVRPTHLLISVSQIIISVWNPSLFISNSTPWTAALPVFGWWLSTMGRVMAYSRYGRRRRLGKRAWIFWVLPKPPRVLASKPWVYSVAGRPNRQSWAGVILCIARGSGIWRRNVRRAVQFRESSSRAGGHCEVCGLPVSRVWHRERAHCVDFGYTQRYGLLGEGAVSQRIGDIFTKENLLS